MGIYLNPGKAAYEEAIHSDIFVDKTEMLQYLNSVIRTKQKYISVSRPRRFGKSIAAEMICAYYDREADSRSTFEKLKIADCPPAAAGGREIHWDMWLGQFDVIHLVMTDFLEGSRDTDDMLAYLTEEVAGELMEAYPEIDYGKRINLRTVLSRIYGRTKREFVIIIDEWDAVFRVWKEDTPGQTRYLDFLREWLKDKSYVALAYITGILPIKKYGEHSALNMFGEYSMLQPMQLAKYTGFTEEEVKELCSRYGRNFEKIRDWYDGYEVSDIIPPDPSYEIQQKTGQEIPAKRYSLYCPLSVVNAVSTGYIRNYWNRTETYEALAEYIRRDYGGLKDAVALLMDGGRLQINTSTYQNDMTTFHSRDDVLTLLIHLGYLGFDDEKSEVFIPNKEVLDEFRSSTGSDEWVLVFRAFETSQELLKATWAMDGSGG